MEQSPSLSTPPHHVVLTSLLSLVILYSLPYRMVFAVAGLDSVLLYDTQHSVPFAFVSNIHYAGITDVTWQVENTERERETYPSTRSLPTHCVILCLVSCMTVGLTMVVCCSSPHLTATALSSHSLRENLAHHSLRISYPLTFSPLSQRRNRQILLS